MLTKSDCFFTKSQPTASPDTTALMVGVLATSCQMIAAIQDLMTIGAYNLF